MEQRITSLLLPAPEAELEASCKELDEKVTWLLHNSRKMELDEGGAPVCTLAVAQQPRKMVTTTSLGT